MTLYDISREALRIGEGESFRDSAIAAIVGRQAIFTTYDGEDLTGTVEATDSHYPIIRFGNGTWARCDDVVHLIS